MEIDGIRRRSYLSSSVILIIKATNDSTFTTVVNVQGKRDAQIGELPFLFG